MVDEVDALVDSLLNPKDNDETSNNNGDTNQENSSNTNSNEMVDKIENNNSNNNEVNSNSNGNTDNTVSKDKSYNSKRVQEFLIRIAKAVTRHQVRINAHKDFHEHVNQLQSNIKENVKKTSGYSPDDEIRSLKEKVNKLIDIRSNPTNINDHSKDKIKELEDKINRLMSSKEEKEKRFLDLEKKIESKYKNEKSRAHELETRILQLEKRLVEHQIEQRRANKKIDHEKVKEIKDVINSTKTQLANIRE